MHTTPERLGPYRLLEQIGSGGMGSVHVAEYEPTGTRRAIKLIQALAPEAALRMQREAQAQAAVDRHPNVVTIHTQGVEAGVHYLVMDLHTGGDLADRLRGGPLPVGEAVRIVSALSRGLAHVHAQGVLHRDLKPANVLFDASGTPMLVDFGLASLAGAESLTQSGDLLGTPSYMAPEQALGERASIGVATDVYGMGALLYHCLTGVPPFTGSITSVLAKVCAAPPAPPRTLRPELPAALEGVCLRALEKAPADRFRDADELRLALEAAHGARSRRGLPVVAGLAALGALGTLLALSANDSRPPTPEAVGAVVPTPSEPPAPTPDAIQPLRPAKDRPTTVPLLDQGVTANRFVLARWLDDRFAVGFSYTEAIVDLWDLSGPTARLVRRYSERRVAPDVERLDDQEAFLIATEGSPLLWASLTRGGVVPLDLDSLGDNPKLATAPGEGCMRVAYSSGKGIRLFELRGQSVSATISVEWGGWGSPSDLAFTPDGRLLAVGEGLKGGLALLYRRDGTLESTSGTVFKVTSVSAHPARDEFVLGTKAGQVWLQTLGKGGRPARTYSPPSTTNLLDAISMSVRAHVGMIRAVAHSRDGRYLYTLAGTSNEDAARRGELRVWRSEGGELLETRQMPDSESLDVSPDDSRLLIGTRAGRIQVWAAHEPGVSAGGRNDAPEVQ